MLQEYVARQRADEWRRASAEHQLLVTSRPEKQSHVARPRWRIRGIWNRAVERPPVQA